MHLTRSNGPKTITFAIALSVGTLGEKITFSTVYFTLTQCDLFVRVKALRPTYCF